MVRTRILAELSTAEDAKKVEESVKTGYADTSIERLTQWAGVEEDLAESYGRLAEESGTAERKVAFTRLEEESKRNVVELSGLVEYLEGLEKARRKRIELLSNLPP
jgi:hypothetical protein